MALIKILIQRKIKPGAGGEFKRLMREVLSSAVQADGFISGETLQSVDDSAVHVTISQWKDMSSWNAWINGAERIKKREEFDKILAEPMKITALHYE
jgi:quinol monooxygenase YgiN